MCEETVISPRAKQAAEDFDGTLRWDRCPTRRQIERAFAKFEAAIVMAYERAPQHIYWMGGEPDCPREIKAGNGELHTLRCKICELDNPRNPICHADAFFERAAVSSEVASA